MMKYDGYIWETVWKIQDIALFTSKISISFKFVEILLSIMY